jgi:hypothetical protein
MIFAMEMRCVFVEILIRISNVVYDNCVVYKQEAQVRQKTKAMKNICKEYMQ